MAWVVLLPHRPCTRNARTARRACRYITARLGGFPYGTLVLPTSTALIAGTGSIASYTTFSTWMLETHRLSEQRQHRHAITNVAASIALGLATAATGLALGAHL